MKKYLLSNKKLKILYLIISILLYASVTFVYKMYSMITSVAETKNWSEAYTIIILCVCNLLILFLLMICEAIIKRKMLKEITYNIRKDIFNKITKMSFSMFYKNETSYYTSILVNDVNMIEENYTSKLIDMISNIIQLVVVLFAIALIGWKYALVICIIAIPSGIQPFIMKKRLSKKGKKVSDDKEVYISKVKEFISSFNTIKMFQRVPIFKIMFSDTIKKLEGTKYKLLVSRMLNTFFALFAVLLLKVCSQIYFTYNAINGVISIAIVTALFGLANNIGNPINFILSYFEPINTTKDVRKKIIEFLNNDTDEEEIGVEIDEIKEVIKLNSVTFGYEKGKNILKDFSASFEKGKKYAIVGQSGCGKSTVLKLLLGYYKNYVGNILFDSIEAKEIKINSLRRCLSYVSQKPYIFNGTLKDNVSICDSNLDKEKYIEIVEKMELKKYLDSLTNISSNSDLDENIMSASGGEKQRINLARALLRDMSFLIIDEGSSALDNITAKKIDNVLLQNKDIGMITVIHRLNESIGLYDCIYYMENGRVVESGSYDELMSKKSKFYNMYYEQEVDDEKQLYEKSTVL